MAKFEWLANELLLELFKYFDGVHLFRAFQNLNSRFNFLLLHYQIYHLDFRSVSKCEFHIICQQYLPSIINRVTSLHLSNDDETPNLFELFLSYYFTFNQFYRLRLLSLNAIHSLSILNQIIFECRQLPYFTHLYIIKCDFKDQEKFSCLINHIWNLPKLIYCQIDHRFPYELKFTNNTIVSSSIENLFVENFNFNLNDLSKLFRCTPSLRQFDATITSHSEYERLQIIPSAIISSKLSFRNALHSMIHLFQNLSNLCHLTIKTQRMYLNGYEWQKIILNYLPKIQVFQLKMDWKFSYTKNIEEQLNQLLDSFRTSFWLEEHQWFVQCDWFMLGISNFVTLYTLPYAFNDFSLANKCWSKSTASNDEFYDHVKILTLINIRTNLFTDSFLTSDDFQNILHLKLSLPLNNHFWSAIRFFDQLTSLDITLIQGADYLPLQILLDRSPRLYSLCFGNFYNIEIVSQLTSRSIHRLDFIKKNTYKKNFNSKQCDVLINSALGRQCEVLLINVENRINILQLVKNMSNLRSLIVQCKDDRWNDEFIQWLSYHLPSTCSVSRDRHQTSNIRLWIC
ncbi:unnamed protein product [Rotaria sordida]|uniref:F-box domain-containing protein n=1 Tax=Rotaria sordida TaxID=392033 RepID=A0A814WW98_9BILA|nr:unnamed protein product [Rotaria sordida]